MFAGIWKNADAGMVRAAPPDGDGTVPPDAVSAGAPAP
jgi:hypothetical protein